MILVEACVNSPFSAIEAEKDDETIITWVTFDGKDKWSEKIKGGLILAEPTDKGVMYVTSERANILTFEKGKDVLSPSYHKAFNSPIGLLNFVKQLRELSGGKPIGFIYHQLY